ncbi:MAG: sigma-70 family RNA polymerase sigma factor [Armatimonadetes bacterium]|nr:sigma-70 family RNA polymerase sigma factor [Armatimonadota bacterium]
MPPGHLDWKQAADETLVTAAQIGDIHAFDELVRRYRPAVTMVARGALSDRDLADDAVQDAFVTAYKMLPQLKDRTKFPAWIHAVVRNRAKRMGASLKESPVDRLILAHSEELSHRPHDEVDNRDEVMRMLEEFEKLPEGQRDIVRLYYLQEWPVARIAAFFSLPETTVKWRLHVARERLRRCLDLQVNK